MDCIGMYAYGHAGVTDELNRIAIDVARHKYGIQAPFCPVALHVCMTD